MPSLLYVSQGSLEHRDKQYGMYSQYWEGRNTKDLVAVERYF